MCMSMSMHWNEWNLNEKIQPNPNWHGLSDVMQLNAI